MKKFHEKFVMVTTVYFEKKEQADWIKMAAKRDERSVSAQIRHLIDKAMKQEADGGIVG